MRAYRNKYKTTAGAACIPVHIYRSRGRVLYNRLMNRVSKTPRILKRKHELKIANDAKRGPYLGHTFERMKSGVAPLLGDPSDLSSLKHNDTDREEVLQH